MEPTINIGDVAFVRKAKDIEQQDIISFRVNNSVVTHRVIEILIDENQEKIYKTKGDANSSEDSETIKQEEIEGKYCFKIPKIGKIILFFRTQAGILVLAVIFALCFFSNGRENTVVYKKRKKGRHAQ